jgi:hypothetical protein
MNNLKLKSWIPITVALFIGSLATQTVIASGGKTIVRVGDSCPSNYRRSGEYCIQNTGSETTPAAIEKMGTCPAGYRIRGNYCAPKNGDTSTPAALEKKGACPPGYKTSGKYCVGLEKSG